MLYQRVWHSSEQIYERINTHIKNHSIKTHNIKLLRIPLFYKNRHGKNISHVDFYKTFLQIWIVRFNIFHVLLYSHHIRGESYYILYLGKEIKTRAKKKIVKNTLIRKLCPPLGTFCPPCVFTLSLYLQA